MGYSVLALVAVLDAVGVHERHGQQFDALAKPSALGAVGQRLGQNALQDVVGDRLACVVPAREKQAVLVPAVQSPDAEKRHFPPLS